MSSKMIRSADIKGNTSYDIILRAWLDHKVHELPAQLSGMLERWRMVDELIRKGEILQKITDDGIINVTKRFSFTDLVEWLREKYTISMRTAYEDIRNAKRFFLSNEGRDDIEYARGVAIEHGELMQWAAFEAGDFDAASKFFKELNVIKGLHEQRVDTPDYSEFIPPSFVFAADPTELGFEPIDNKDEIVKRILADKRIKFLESEATDVEIEEADQPEGENG
jgi:hypothetical protein